jgi:hypothetical protein
MLKYLKETPSRMQHKGNYIEIFRNSKIPHKVWFAIDLTNQNMEITNYLKIHDNSRNLYEFLKDYNNSDVHPAVEAIGKLSVMLSSLNLDIHKVAISIPGLSLKSLWSSKQPGSEIKDNMKLYDMYLNNLVGCPSIVFHNYNEEKKTLIRNQKGCKKVVGFDANALYLWAIGQDMLNIQFETLSIQSDVNSESRANIEHSLFASRFKGKCRSCGKMGHKAMQCKVKGSQSDRQGAEDSQPLYYVIL